MKLLILTAMFFNMCICLFLATGSINSSNLINQNNNKITRKEKTHKNKDKKAIKSGKCSIKKCKVT